MKKKILVVDDDRVMLKFVTKLLTRDGHEVLTAADGFAALNLLATFSPDIIFFDLIMPKIDGGKLIQIVRSMPQLKDCYLVIVSAAVAEIDFDFQETGADSYIAKVLSVRWRITSRKPLKHRRRPGVLRTRSPFAGLTPYMPAS